MNFKTGLLTTVVGLGLSINAWAAPTPYPNAGTQNPQTYTFTAASTGDLIAYFAGSSAGYDETVSLLVNGVDTGLTGLQNHSSSYGQQFNFGHVNAGDSLVFRLNVTTTGDTFFSDAGMNSDRVNHVYSSAFAGDGIIPMGIYLAFEDLRNGGDFNYHDDTFVFTNVNLNPVSSVPVPAAVWLFGSALTGLFGFGKRKSAKSMAA